MPRQPDRSAFDRLVARLLEEGGYDRRQFLARAGGTGLAVTGAGTLLAACGGVKGTQEDKTQVDTNVSHPKVPITDMDFSNWPLYINRAVLKQYDQQTGGKVKYIEDINDNEEFYAKVRQQLEAGRPIGRDLVVLTDWMAERWVKNNYVTPIDQKNVPNAKNLQPGLKNPTWDPGRKFSLVWQSGMTGIGYNPKKTGRKLTSVNDLFDPKFKGRVSMLADQRDSSNLVMISRGIDPRQASIDDVLAAIDKIGEENDKGQIRRFTGNDYTTDLAKGNLWAAVAYSGDIYQLKADNPDLEFLIPEEGATLWSDNIFMPAKVAHPYAAEVMMNLVYEPEAAAEITKEVAYVSPVVGVQEILEKSDPKLAEDQLVFPDDETRKRLYPFPSLTPAEERQANVAMAKVTGA